MFNIIGSFAEFEHDIRTARQMEGLKKALIKGITFGRKNRMMAQKKKSSNYENDLILPFIVSRLLQFFAN